MWITDRYYYSESDIKQIAEYGHLLNTYEAEERQCERLDYQMAKRELRRLDIYSPNYQMIAIYLNGGVECP
jgi:hypothetical protein